jgi:hypothetical protein
MPVCTVIQRAHNGQFYGRLFCRPHDVAISRLLFKRSAVFGLRERLSPSLPFPSLGSDKPGGDAIALIAIDSPADDQVIARLKAFEHVKRVQRLEF